MSSSGEFCPRCGDSVPERVTPPPGAPRERADVLCDDCYLSEFDLVDAPDRVEVVVCATCGAVQRGEHWADVGARDYTDVAVDAVRESLGVHRKADNVRWGVEPEQVDETTIRMHATFSGAIRGTPVDETVTVPVKIGQGTCDRCGRIAGDYYASILQVRADGRTPDDEELRRARELVDEVVADAADDREAFVAEIGTVDAGLDAKLSTNKLGRAAADRIVAEFGGNVAENPTLVTEDEDGEGVYRVTYAARLPRYRAGEVIDPRDGDGPILVLGAHTTLTGVRLATGERYEIPVDDAPEARRLGQRSEAPETTVVAVEDEHAVQVLDPETYEAVTVPRPEFFDPDADAVRAIRHREGLHLIPEGDPLADGD